MLRDLLKRSSWLAFGAAAGRLLPLAALMLASRQMESQQFASASAGYAWSGVAMSLTSAGAATVMTQRLGATAAPADRAALFARHGRQALSASLLLAAAVALVGGRAGSLLFGAALDPAVILPAAIAGALWSQVAICIAALNGCHRPRTAAMVLATCGVLQGAGMSLALYHFGPSAQAVAWGLVFGCLLACIAATVAIAGPLLMPALRGAGPVATTYPAVRWWRDAVLWNSLASAAALPVAFVAAALISHGADGTRQLAQYFALEQVHQLIVYLPGIVGQALLPLLSRHLAAQPGEAQRAIIMQRLAWTALASAALGLPLALLASVDAGWLVRLLGNPALTAADQWPVRGMLLNASMSLGLSLTGSIFLASGRLVSAAALNLSWAAAFLGLTALLAGHGNAGLQAARLVATLALEIVATVVLLARPAAARTTQPTPVGGKEPG